MITQQQLEDLVKTVQALSTNDLSAGAQILTLHTNPNFTEEPFKELYKNLKEKMPNQPTQVENYIESLKMIRIACLEKPEAKKYVENQAEQMVKMSATNDFTRRYTEEKSQKSKGCSIA